jgi:hypothetical protein
MRIDWTRHWDVFTQTRHPDTQKRFLSTEFLAMWAVALIGAGVLRNVEDADFERFIGTMSPIVAVAVAGVVGSAALAILDSAGWVGSDPKRRGLARSTLLALGLGAAIIVADTVAGFGESINVIWPTSILFYPVMEFIAEVAFHLVPLAFVVTVSRRWTLRDSGLNAAAMPIIVVALFEAIYQVLGSASADVSRWLLAYLGLHMSAFAVAGLAGLRRYGFGAMMWLRLAYYAIWHVAWGVFRLDLIF